MKSILRILLAAFFLAPLVQAAPMLLVEASLTEQHADGSKDIVNARPAVIVAGAQTILSLGAYEMAITPQLNDGSVVVAMLITKGPAAKLQMIARPTMIVQLGAVMKVETGDLAFTLVVTLQK